MTDEELKKVDFSSLLTLSKNFNDGKGLRFNSGKLNLSYCPLSTQIAVASVFAASSVENGGKYPDNNWMRGMNWSTPIACAKRHLEAFISGEDLDPQSGVPHLWHVQANIAMLIEYSVIFPSGDDRPSTKGVIGAQFKDLLNHYDNALKKNQERNEK